MLLSVPGLGEIRVDTAYGGDTFVIVDAEAQQLAELGVKITDAANATLRFEHPENPE